MKGGAFVIRLLPLVVAVLAFVSTGRSNERITPWREAVPPDQQESAEVAAILAYATYLAAEPADWAGAESQLLAGLRLFPRQEAYIAALLDLWRDQNFDDAAIAEQVLRKLRPLAEKLPDCEMLVLTVAHAERQSGDPTRARHRLERFARYAGWGWPLIVREWLLCLDPRTDVRRATWRLEAVENMSELRGNWVFERAAADFLLSAAENSQREWTRRQNQQAGWRHLLRAGADVDQSATAETATPIINRLLAVGLEREAFAILQNLARRDSKNLNTETWRARLLERNGDWAAACDIWRMLAGLHRTLAVYHLGVARCADRLGRRSEADDALEKAVAVTIDPRQSLPLGLMTSKRFRDSGQLARALKVLQRLPATTDVRVRQALLLRELGEIEQAYQAVLPAVQAADGSPRAADDGDGNQFALAGRLAMETGRWQHAGSFLAQAGALRPADAALQVDLALALVKCGDREEIARQLARLVPFAERDSAVALDLARLYAAAGEPQQALTWYERRLDTGASALLEEAAWSAARIPDPKKAIALLGRIPAVEATEAQLRTMAEWLIAQNEATAACAVLLGQLPRFPQSHGMRNQLAWAWCCTGQNLELAEKLAREAVSMIPDSPEYLDTLAWILYGLNKYFSAAEEIELALSVSGGALDPVVLEHAGDIYHALGDRVRARGYWQQALNLSPGSEVLKTKLKQDSMPSEGIIQ